jgi:hypothetical protein
MPIIVHGDSSKFKTATFAIEAALGRTVKDVVVYGDLRMTSLVPKGKGKLAAAVTHSGPTIIAPGHFVGATYVDPELAPHADLVNRGTGVDGPFHTPVTILRPARRGTGPGRMRFIKNGESGGKGIYRVAVKIHPSSKIERGKNFLPKTFDAMVGFTRARVTILGAEIAHHFQ